MLISQFCPLVAVLTLGRRVLILPGVAAMAQVEILHLLKIVKLHAPAHLTQFPKPLALMQVVSNMTTTSILEV
jgi:hypothetical protein